MGVVMKVLHSAALLNPPLGVLNQMDWEQSAASDMGLDWTVRMCCPVGSAAESPVTHHFPAIDVNHADSPLRKFKAWFELRRTYHRWLLSLQNDYDVFLLRYYVHDPFQLAFIKQARKPVCLIHHTLEVPELAMAGGLPGLVRAFAEKKIGPRSIRASQATIGVTSEIVGYELGRAGLPLTKGLIYPNGILYRANATEDRRSGIPELLFVASDFPAWHGVDLLLDALGRYQGELILHLVGPIADEFKDAASSDSRIRLHGRLTHSEIVQLASQCHVGLSSFALYRKGMTEACTLKVREYLMLGLPVYAGYRDIFPEEFPYYRCGECDLEAILEFARACDKKPRSLISAAAKPYIDKHMLIRSLSMALSSELRLSM
jgi:glycosyltransferase involved in cell wall biosynthesis